MKNEKECLKIKPTLLDHNKLYIEQHNNKTGEVKKEHIWEWSYVCWELLSFKYYK